MEILLNFCSFINTSPALPPVRLVALQGHVDTGAGRWQAAGGIDRRRGEGEILSACTTP